LGRQSLGSGRGGLRGGGFTVPFPGGAGQLIRTGTQLLGQGLQFFPGLLTPGKPPEVIAQLLKIHRRLFGLARAQM
jgi:hypothetical protein